MLVPTGRYCGAALSALLLVILPGLTTAMPPVPATYRSFDFSRMYSYRSRFDPPRKSPTWLQFLGIIIMQHAWACSKVVSPSWRPVPLTGWQRARHDWHVSGLPERAIARQHVCSDNIEPPCSHHILHSLSFWLLRSLSRGETCSAHPIPPLTHPSARGFANLSCFLPFFVFQFYIRSSPVLLIPPSRYLYLSPISAHLPFPHWIFTDLTDFAV